MKSAAIVLWNPPGALPLPELAMFLEQAIGQGGASALAAYCREHTCQGAYVHGERHDLWWEFPLSASFRWQAHVCRLGPDLARRRQFFLASALGLRSLLDRPVEALTPAQRSRANLAVALLPKPDLLVWEEPLASLSTADSARVGRLVRMLCRAESMTVVALSAEPLGLQRLDAAPIHALKSVGSI